MSIARADPRLVLPSRPPGFVARPRLVESLDLGEQHAVTLVAAGPGAGKSVLLSEWAHRRDAPTAWLALAAGDDDPRRFWRLFLAALTAAGVAGRDLTAPGPDTPATELLDALLPHVPESGAPPVLVLDDAHVLHDPDILDGLDRIVRGWQPRLRLVLGARSDPLLPLHRYRLAGQLHELRAADLAMTPPEARELLAAHQVRLPDREFDQLLRRTEGWTAGLRLSALRMQGAARPADFVAELALDEGSIGEYLVEEVLDRQPDVVRRLLIETSFLPEVTGPLARAVTGIEDAGELLADVARTNAFVVPLDREYSRFRCHQLMSEILRCLLLRRSANQVRTLFGRAAAWYEQHGELTEALRWYIRAEDDVATAAVFVRGGLARAHVRGDDLAATGIQDIVRQVEPEIVSADPDVATLHFLVNLDLADPARALDRLLEWRTALDATGPDPRLRVTARIAELRLARRAGAWTTVEAAATALLDDDRCTGTVAATAGLRASLLLSRAAARFWQGDTDRVTALLNDALTAAQHDRVVEVQAEILGMASLCHTYFSRPEHAATARTQALALLESAGDLTTPVTLDLAEVLRLLIASDFDRAALVLRKLGATAQLDADAGLAGSVALAQAALLGACGQVAEARATLKGAPALDGTAIGLIAMQRDAALADMETALGRPNGALRLLDRYRATPLRQHLAVQRARALLALGEVSAAGDCVRSVLTSGTGGIGRYAMVEALLCDAQIADQQDDPSRCIELLARATEIADGDIVLPFARLADVFAATLARHPTMAARWPVPLRPHGAFDSIAPHAGELPEPLTERERAVLRYLATSMSTAEIASELFLSVNTIKTHLAAIYRKLAARRRREAVLRARELELL